MASALQLPVGGGRRTTRQTARIAIREGAGDGRCVDVLSWGLDGPGGRA